jgi:subtilisin family serine protease
VGVIYVVAAGNGGTDAANWVPAAYPEVITVSNVQDLDGRGGALGGTGDDTLASSSNYGAAVDVAAPGSNILSTVPVGDCGFCSSSGYALLTGTSMAAPHVSGVIAEYIERHPGVSTVGAQNMLAPAAVQALAPGQPQTSACGFSGDPDATPEPVIYGGAPDSDCGATPTPDTDADGLPDIVESGVYGTSPTSADTDGDGCPDGREAGENETSGGRRNPRADGLGRWDFYDVNGSQKVDALDIAMVRSKFNGTGPTPPADTPFDRSGGLHPWAPGPPDNKINALDIGLVRASFGHTCR